MHITQSELVGRFDVECTRDVLYTTWFLPARKFLLTNQQSEKDAITLLASVDEIDIKKHVPKKDLIAFCARFYSKPLIVKDFHSAQPAAWRFLIDEFAWFQEVGREELEQHFGKPVLFFEARENVRYFSSSDVHLIPELKYWESAIKITFGHWSFDYPPEMLLTSAELVFVMPELVRDIFQDLVPKPQGYDIEAVPRPDREHLVFFNAEKDIFRELPLIISYYQQGKIKYSQKGYPNAASTRKLAKTLKLKDFIADNDQAHRSLLIAGLLSDRFKVKTLEFSSLDILKGLLRQNFDKCPPAPYLLNHLKGLHYLYYDDYHNGVTEDILDLIKFTNNGQWVTFSNLKTYVSCRDISCHPLRRVHYKITAIDISDALKGEINITRANFRSYMDWPYLAGHIYLLAAFGLVELAIDNNKIPQKTYYDGLYAFKLTALGLHILGLEKNYSPPEEDNLTQFTFDENSTLIRVEGNIDLGDTMLSDYAVKVSENRYQFSPGKLMKDCKSTKDLERKIAFFRATVGKKIPSFWDIYLQQLLVNSRAVARQEKMVVFRLPEENRELQRTVAQDESLRKIVLKAEKFMIIVAEEKQSLFVARMKELGYLIGQ